MFFRRKQPESVIERVHRLELALAQRKKEFVEIQRHVAAMEDAFTVDKLPDCKTECRQFCQMSVHGICDRSMYKERT